MSLSDPKIDKETEDNPVELKGNEIKANLSPSTQQQRDIAEARQNYDNITKMAAKNQADRNEGKETSISNGFFEALGFFLPTIVGGAVGGSIGGNEGVVQGAKLGMEASDSYRKFKADQLSRTPTPLQLKRIEQAEENIELRGKELKVMQESSFNREKDRAFRAEERDIERTVKIKESFARRDDVQKLKERMANLNQIEDLVNDAPELAAGVVPFKIAKGIAGEVGNLTQAEREDAQISPSFYRKLQRSGTAFLTGRLPQEDVKELQKIVSILKRKENGRLYETIENFSKSRAKALGDKNAKHLSSDLKLEYGLDEPKKEDQSFSREEIEEAKRKIRESKKK